MKLSKLCAFFLFAAMLVSLLPTVAQAETPIVEYVDYDITADTTWHAGDYYICKVDNREPRVTNGATLTIESGAKIYFSTRTTATLPGTESDPKNPYSSLTVTNGTLSATSVAFTTVPDSPEETTWQMPVGTAYGPSELAKQGLQACLSQTVRLNIVASTKTARCMVCSQMG